MAVIYAVGDIHGRLDELKRVLEMILHDASVQLIDRPRVVFLGDYIDRGPDSRGVLDLLTDPDLARHVDAIFLLGNHDATARDIDQLWEMADPVDWLDTGGVACLASYGVEVAGRPFRAVAAEFHHALPERHRVFLRTLQSSYREGDWLFTHGGIDPFRAEPDQVSLVYGNRNILRFDADPGLGKELRCTLGLRLVHGHFYSPAVQVFPHRVGIDTGCGTYPDGRLSAVALNGDDVRVLGE